MKTETTIRTIEFTVEKSETRTIRRSRTIVEHWCSDCGREARMAKPEDVSQITGISTRQIYAGIEAGYIHFAESSESPLMVCVASARETQQVK